MVTHDVGLKDFADRIIWMRDGKIKYVEITEKASKLKRIEKLENDLKATIGERKKRELFSNTFIRKPEDYITHPKHTQQDIKKISV